MQIKIYGLLQLLFNATSEKIRIMNVNVEIATSVHVYKMQVSNSCIASEILAQSVFHIFVPALRPFEQIPN